MQHNNLSLRKALLRLGKQLAPLCFWLAVWALCYRAIGQDLLLASPTQVGAKLLSLVFTPLFWQSIALSLLRTLCAYLLGVALGCLLAVLCHAFAFLDVLLRPALSVLRATPVASFIILALVWLSSSNVPIFAGLLMVLPVVFSSVFEGIRATDPLLLEMAHMYRFGLAKTIRHVYFPSLLPAFLAACEACIGLCFKATIAAEVIGVPKGAVGTQLHNAKIYLETDALMAWTLTIIVCSMLLERVLKAAFGRGRHRVH